MLIQNKTLKIEVIKDFFGWAVSIVDTSKNIERVKMGFLSKEEAEEYAKKAELLN